MDSQTKDEINFMFLLTENGFRDTISSKVEICFMF